MCQITVLLDKGIQSEPANENPPRILAYKPIGSEFWIKPREDKLLISTRVLI